MIEADVSDVHVVYVYFWSDYAEDRLFALSPIVAEPNVNYEVHLRATDDLFITSRKGRHAELIESWQQSTEYQTKFDAYEKSYLAFETEQARKERLPNNPLFDQKDREQRTEAVASSEETSDTETVDDTTVAQEVPKNLTPK